MEKYELTPEQLAQYIAVLDAVETYRDLSDEEKEKIVRKIMDHPYMDLCNDWAFKHVFRDLKLVKMLLEDVLPEEIVSVEPLEDLEAIPNEIDRLRPDDKNIIMDVLVKTKDDREIIIEMQRKHKKSFKNRMVYYGASMIHDQLKRKEPYWKMRPVYVLCFMDFNLKHETDQLLYHYTLREVTSGERYGNQLSIFLFELKRFRKNEMTGLSPIESWLYILKNMGKFAGKPEELGERYREVAEASKIHDLPDKEKLKYLQDMISEEEMLDMREATLEEGREEARELMRQEMEDMREATLEEGIEIGNERASLKIAKNLVKMGMKDDFILQATGISKEELDSVK